MIESSIIHMNKIDINKIPQLSALGVDNSIDSIAQDLETILSMIETISEVQTDQSFTSEQKQPVRKDIAKDHADQEHINSTAISTEAGFYTVPKFIDNQDA